MGKNIHNIMEDFVYDMMDTVLNTKSNICTCDKCKDDIAALTLNKLPPRYVSSDMGGLYTRTEILNGKLQTSIVVQLTESAERVSSNPRHG